MTAETDDGEGLLALLAELGRLELDLLVRDQDVTEAVGTLHAMREELQAILRRADQRRRGLRTRLAALERELAVAWPGGGAAESLRKLADVRRTLVELDTALQPAQVLYDEVDRRCSRRASGSKSPTQEPKEPMV